MTTAARWLALAVVFALSLTQVIWADNVDPTPRKGVVKWFDPIKAYGFIKRDDGENNVFVHVTALQRKGLETVAAGQCVWFTFWTNEHGKTAAHEVWPCEAAAD